MKSFNILPSSLIRFVKGNFWVTRTYSLHIFLCSFVRVNKWPYYETSTSQQSFSIRIVIFHQLLLRCLSRLLNSDQCDCYLRSDLILKNEDFLFLSFLCGTALYLPKSSERSFKN